MPDAVLAWGVNAIAWLQQASPLLDWPFRALTALGNIEFILLFVPLIYWSVDRQAGIRLGLFYVLSALVNGLVKAGLRQPRPHDFDATVRTLSDASGYGLPSGHTQNSLVLWGAVAARWRKPWVRCICGTLIVLVPLSRVYLGVHFPTDVLGGYLLGAALLWLLLTISARQPRGVPRPWLAPIVTLAVVAIQLPFLARLPDDVARGDGALLGLACGLALERHFVRFSAEGPRRQRVARAILGLLGLAGLYLGLSALMSAWEPVWLWRIVRYSVVGLWMAWGAPALFVRLGLANRDDLWHTVPVAAQATR